MNEKQILLLEEQITKLEQKEFNLEAWKSSTIIILEKIFGSRNQKIEQIEKIHVDYSSWTLRDTSGSVTKLDACKRRAREILETCIAELKLGEQKKQMPIEEILEKITENDLTIGQFKELAKMLESDKKEKEIKNQLTELFKNVGNEQLLHMLVNAMFELRG
ncbi:hypothetical protein [Xanthovirga aplysinae]|uniref:hypothetical protein n=1 Tax=Xanthovirga aplysinae TaxID=2529853 RepID=UPI0012BC9DCC|nr:hypothetical protein [Xanthovirga aplysinae]MTI30056.1 hypothetical protein [Xanthovirga aplysinae]